MTENAKPYSVGQPVPWTWQLGTATTSVDKIEWENGPPTQDAKLLKLQVTVVALTGQADFDIELWSAMSSDGRLLRPDAAVNPGSDANSTWKRFNAGESYQGWVTFTVPYGPTEVYYTVLGQRLAVWSVTGREPLVRPSAESRTPSPGIVTRSAAPTG